MSKIITAKDAEKVKQYELRPHQLKWLDTAIELSSDSPTEISQESGLSKQSWYNWIKEPGFEDKYYEEYKRRRRRWLPTLDKIGMKKAKSDYNYWRDMNKKVGDTPDEGGREVQINNLIKIE